MFTDKPLGMKSYGSIPHIRGSRMGPGDHHIHDGQARIATEKFPGEGDWFCVVEVKLDGSNVSVAKIGTEIVAMSRAGYRASQSPHEQHRLFDRWVRENWVRFDALLMDGERICGEWLAQAHGTRYSLTHEPFVPFDLMSGHTRVLRDEFWKRVHAHGFTTPHVLHADSSPFSLDAMKKAIETPMHGELDPVEGAVWRVERHDKRKIGVQFLCKYVRPEKVDGSYLFISGQSGKLDPTWNWKP